LLVKRPHLLAQLDLAVQYRLILIAAPAGFGKTTLLVSWLASTDRGTVAWLSLDEGDNDPVRLLRALATAVRHVAPQVGEAALAVLNSGYGRDPQGPLLGLLHELEGVDDRIVLVLDDIHLLCEPGAIALLASLADLLRHRLQQRHPGLIPVLHRRAAHWLNAQGLADDAIRHALAGSDLALAAELIAAEGRARLARGERVTLQGWLDALPPGQVMASPQLTILRAWSLVWTYEPAAVSALLPALEGAPPDLHAEVLALRAFVARSRDHVADAVQLSEQALGCAPDNPLLQGFLYAGLGDTAWFTEDAARAIACHGCALECATRSGDLVQLVDAAHSLVQFELLQGRLGAAEATYHYAIELLTARGAVGQPFGELLALSRAGVLFERYELEPARAAAEQALSQAARCGLSIYAPFAQLELARITALQGDAAAAQRALVAVQQGFQRMLAQNDSASPVWAATIELRQLEVLIALSDGPAIVRWVQRHWTPPDPAASVMQILHQLGLTLALVSNHELPELHAHLGDRTQVAFLDLAEALLYACLTRFRTWGLGAVVLELQTLSAVLHAASGDTRESEVALADALRLAATEGFMRPFVSRGEPMRRLLTAGLLRWPGDPARQPLIPFAEQVLAAFPAELAVGSESGSQVIGGTTPPLPEQLSLREREVLPLLAAGLSHREIAERLTIAPDTARTHIKNIYGKLQVRNRVEALAQARAYGLL
jgi:LuxR family maltose regulon positive regulatory protein